MIPAVVGCGDATVRIRDGQMIEVDGTTGVVRFVD
jgi:phosphohistidine swiveling domain-containing protein